MASRSKPPRLRGPGAQSYEVGYGKPPTSTRFEPGRSGNPRGRPKGSRNKQAGVGQERLKEILLAEAYRSIRINDGERQIKVPMAQAIIRSLAVNAVKGQQRAQRLFTELLSATERADRRLADEWMDMAITYKVEWERELERRARLGITGPEPLPHPDHVIVDIRGGTAEVRGPATREEKAEWDMWVERREIFEAELDELESMLAVARPADKEDVSRAIEKTKAVLRIIAAALRCG